MPRVEEFNKDQVLRKAMCLFWEKGYKGTSMQELVDATGLNRSSIYNSFGSKEELYARTLTLYQREGGGIFQKALLKANNPLEAIRIIFESFLPEIIGDEKGKGCFAMNCKAEMGNKDENIQKWLLSQQEYTLSMFEDLIKEGQEQGLINTEETSTGYAYFIFNAFQGYRMTGILIRDPKVLQNIIDNSIKVLE